MDEHNDELEEERERRRACAKHMMMGRVTSWPLSKAGWISWLDQEPTALDKALQLAEAGYQYTPPRLGAQAQQRVERAALEGHRHKDCHLCGVFRRQVLLLLPSPQFVCTRRTKQLLAHSKR